jgi:hypothetical protein
MKTGLGETSIWQCRSQVTVQNFFWQQLAARECNRQASWQVSEPAVARIPSGCGSDNTFKEIPDHDCKLEFTVVNNRAQTLP